MPNPAVRAAPARFFSSGASARPSNGNRQRLEDMRTRGQSSVRSVPLAATDTVDRPGAFRHAEAPASLAEERVAAEASVVDRSFVLLTCSIRSVRGVLMFLRPIRGGEYTHRVFEAWWVFYFCKMMAKSCVQVVTTRIHVHSQSHNYQNP